MKTKFFAVIVVLAGVTVLSVATEDSDFYNTKSALISGCARSHSPAASRPGSDYSSKLALRSDDSEATDAGQSVAAGTNYNSKKALLGTPEPEVEIAPVR